MNKRLDNHSRKVEYVADGDTGRGKYVFVEEEKTPRFWVVLANGELKDDLTEAQHMRYSNGGETIDGGQQS